MLFCSRFKNATCTFPAWLNVPYFWLGEQSLWRHQHGFSPWGTSQSNRLRRELHCPDLGRAGSVG